MHSTFEIAIIGGGLAGLVNAIDLSQQGFSVVMLERKNFPRHKVCGEYVSNEIKPYLETLGAYPTSLHPKKIQRLEISAPSGKIVSTNLGMGGFGISRFVFDNFLYQKAQQAGARIFVNEKVVEVCFNKERFQIKTASGLEVKAKVVIGAYGKRSNLDKNLNRDFMKHKTSYVGIKQHYRASFPDDLVQLHNFSGGYCGLSRVEKDVVNLCYLIDKSVLEGFPNIGEMERKHLSDNPHLKNFFEAAKPVFDQPLVISQINFDKKPAVENHILMSGDSAGLIHPFCGNGMAMAIRSAQICSGLVAKFLQGEICREKLENDYQRAWKKEFHLRLSFGRGAGKLFGKNWMSELGLGMMRTFPGLMKNVTKLSHGKMVPKK